MHNMLWQNRNMILVLQYAFTVLPAKSDSDVMFCLQSYQEFIIDI